MFILTRQVGKTNRDPGPQGLYQRRKVETQSLSRAREMKFGGKAQARLVKGLPKLVGLSSEA